MKTMHRLLLVAALGALVPLAASANHHAMKEVPMANKLIIDSLDGSSDKVLQLAKAIPEDKYGWSPMEGVASVAGVLSHVSSANYFIGSMLGATIPEGIKPRELGKGASKAELIAIYEASVAFAKKAVEGVSADAMKEEIDFFGGKAPRGKAAMILADHGHEHLGQLIAYARSNKIVPPWTK